MALSEQERKLLEQLEASLMADDPKFAETLRGDSHFRVHRRRATLAGLGFLAGLVILVAGMQVHPVVSIVGFLAMLVAAIIGISSWQRVTNEGASMPPNPDSSPTAAGRAPSGDSKQEFMDRLEERWRRRQEGGDA